MINLSYFTSGLAIYVVIRNAAGQVWNKTILAFEAYNAANWTDYAVPMSEQGATAYYSVAFPVAITTSDLFTLEERVRAAGSAALSDIKAGSGEITWNGTQEVTVLNAVVDLSNINLSSGSVAVTFHIRDSLGAGVAAATIFVKGLGTGIADGSGNFPGFLSPGTYSVHVVGSGLLFTDQTITVVAVTPQTVTFTGTSTVNPPTPPTDPTTCVIYVDLTDTSATIIGSLQILQLPQLDEAGDRWIAPNKIQRVTADNTGRITFAAVPRHATVRLIVDAANLKPSPFIVPDADTYGVLAS